MSTLSVTIPDSIRRRAEALAKEDAVSIDQFIATAMAEKIAVLDANAYIADRAARGSRATFEALLAKVPDVEPAQDDDKPAGI